MIRERDETRASGEILEDEIELDFGKYYKPKREEYVK